MTSKGRGSAARAEGRHFQGVGEGSGCGVRLLSYAEGMQGLRARGAVEGGQWGEGTDVRNGCPYVHVPLLTGISSGYSRTRTPAAEPEPTTIGMASIETSPQAAKSVQTVQKSL